VMAVTSPHTGGMGGDVLAVVSPPGGPPLAMLGAGRAGSGADAAALRSRGDTVMPLHRDVATVPVPGAVDGWTALHERFGRLPLARVLEPAIGLAEDGFVASVLLVLASSLVAGLPGTEELCPGGQPMHPEQVVRLPGLARTLRAIAADSRDGFYAGEAGAAILDLGEGQYEPDDFRRSFATWAEPLRLRAFGHDLWTVPPPSHGYLTLAGAHVAEAVGLPGDASGPDEAAWAHLLVEASRAVGHDRPAVLHEHADGPALLSPARLDAAAARIRPDRAAPPDVEATAAGDTTHLCAIDADGLGVSLTQSNALGFGSQLVAGATGIFLHNRGVGFSLVPGHPAELGPRRRPPHTLSPAAATRPDGSLALLLGTMGGDAQPQILLQLLARVLVAGQGAGEAVAAPRFTLDAPSAGPFRMWHGSDLRVRIESHAPPAWAAGLEVRGHIVETVPALSHSAGHAQMIAVRGEGASRVVEGGTDPRSPEGGAVGW
jgi:gamma-glutamyltranspeptidase/glutathione hydrolase